MRNYEVYLIINPELASDDTEKLIDKIEKIIKNNLNVTDVTIDKEGVKKMAYPIKKKWTGFYISFIFQVDPKSVTNLHTLERFFNLEDNVIRFLISNLEHFNKLKSKEKLNKTEINNHRDLNKGKKKKLCIVRHLGIEDVSYKDVEFLSQFVSPYAKIFSSDKTGTSAKYQRKITRAIKRSRHMALMPFTTKHFS
jgi:small subunit ribosomal protein S18